MKFDTMLLHGCKDPFDTTGATLPPIYQNSAFDHESAEALERIFDNKAPGFAYTRIGNPTVDAFERRMAFIEDGLSAIACASGMAAISMALLGILQNGDEIISSSALFGGTLDLLDGFERFGIHTCFVEEMSAGAIEAHVTKNTKAIFAELIGNPGLNVVNVEELSDAAKRHGVPLIIDSTTATPALVQPLKHGADIVVHSSSKYINGNGSALGGVIVDGGKFEWDFDKFPSMRKYRNMGKLAFTAQLRQDIWRNFGPCISPQNAYLSCLGLETLGLRMERLCLNALTLAKSLERNSNVMEVNYPGLESSPYKKNIDSQMEDGRGGALLTLRTGTKERAFKLIDNLKYAHIATNVGDVRTLVIHPASTIYAHSTEEQKRVARVYDDLIRVSVGLEDADDLVADFAQAAAK
jgi:O-acetylhomoserine (thiol)-lyase